MQVITQQGDTVDLVCHRFYGRTADIVEAVLIANPKLTFLPAILPVGTVIEMPDLTHSAAQNTSQIQLWD